MFKNRKNRIIALVILILFIIILLLCFPFYSAKSNYCYELEQMQAEGIPLTPERYAAKYYKAVPESENAYKIFGKAFSKLKEASFPSLLIFEGRAQSPWLDQKLSSDLMKYDREYLQKNSEAFSEIEKVMEYSYLRFPYNWSKGFGRKMIPANNIRKIIYLYAIQIEIAIYDGNHTKAKQYLKNMFHITNLIKQEPTLLAQVVSQFCTSVTINCLERCINNCRFDFDELKFFIKKCDEAEKSLYLNWSLVWLNQMAMLADLATPSKLKAIGLFDYKENDINRRLLSAQYDFISGNMYRAVTKELRMAHKIIKTPLLPYLVSIKNLEEIANEAKEVKILGISHSALPMCDIAYTKLLKTLAYLRCAKTACAIKCFQVKYSKLPKTLHDIVPQFLPKLPRDTFSGNTLYYRHGYFKVKYKNPVIKNIKLEYETNILKKKGFYIYSVGKNLTNDICPALSKNSSKSKNINFVIIEK